MIRLKLDPRSMKRFATELARKAKKRVGPAMALEMKEVIRDNSEALVDIRGRKMKKLTARYAKYKSEVLGLPAQPDLRVTGSYLDNAQQRGNILTPLASDAPKAEGLSKQRMSYPEQDKDVSKKSMKRLISAGERALES